MTGAGVAGRAVTRGVGVGLGVGVRPGVGVGVGLGVGVGVGDGLGVGVGDGLGEGVGGARTVTTSAALTGHGAVPATQAKTRYWIGSAVAGIAKGILNAPAESAVPSARVAPPIAPHRISIGIPDGKPAPRATRVAPGAPLSGSMTRLGTARTLAGLIADRSDAASIVAMARLVCRRWLAVRVIDPFMSGLPSSSVGPDGDGSAAG